jgi:hypothetical protein
MIRKSVIILTIMIGLGFFFGLWAASYFTSDKRIGWEYIGVAPEKPVGFINTYSGYILKGSSGSLYANCGVDCWTTEDTESWLDYQVEDFNCPETDPPELPGVIYGESFCKDWGVGLTIQNFGVLNDGSVYIWEKRIGEYGFLEYVFYPVAGVVGFFLIGLFVILVIWFNQYLENLRTKALDRNDENKKSPA